MVPEKHESWVGWDAKKTKGPECKWEWRVWAWEGWVYATLWQSDTVYYNGYNRFCNCVFIITDKSKLVGEEVKGVGVMKDEELKFEEIKSSHTLGG